MIRGANAAIYLLILMLTSASHFARAFRYSVRRSDHVGSRVGHSLPTRYLCMGEDKTMDGWSNEMDGITIQTNSQPDETYFIKSAKEILSPLKFLDLYAFTF